MITKAIIQSINGAGNRCIVRMPLFETAASSAPVTAEALVNITPGLFNNLNVNDVVFIAFEENALEKPVILGKLFKGSLNEAGVNGGMGILDTLKVHSAAAIPAASTTFVFPTEIQALYKDLKTPKKMADYLIWLELFVKKILNQLEEHFTCFKNWTQWQLRPENVEIDDGDLDTKNYKEVVSFLYQEEGAECKVCANKCTKDNTRCYTKLTTDYLYPKI